MKHRTNKQRTARKERKAKERKLETPGKQYHANFNIHAGYHEIIASVRTRRPYLVVGTSGTCVRRPGGPRKHRDKMVVPFPLAHASSRQGTYYRPGIERKVA